MVVLDDDGLTLVLSWLACLPACPPVLRFHVVTPECNCISNANSNRNTRIHLSICLFAVALVLGCLLVCLPTFLWHLFAGVLT